MSFRVDNGVGGWGAKPGVKIFFVGTEVVDAVSATAGVCYDLYLHKVDDDYRSSVWSR